MSDTGPSPIRGRLAERPLLVVCGLVLVSLLFNGYYLGGGFQADEFFFLNLLRAGPDAFSRWHGVWSVADVPGLTNLWWVEDLPELAFWRPVPSIVFETSIRLFGERALPLHLLSVLLHGLVAATLYLLLRRLGAPVLGLIAALLFLSCEDHSMGVGWISTNTDLICALFVNLALLAHAHWLVSRRKWALAASLVALVPAFLSKESAALVPLAMALMTLILPGGTDDSERRRLHSRLSAFIRNWPSWAPALVLMVAYLVVYKSLGYGAMDSGMYVDPVTDPLRFARHAVLNLPIFWLATLTPVPPSGAMFLPASIPYLAAAGSVVFALFLAALWPLRRSGLLLWGLGFYLVALLPQLATFASERGLYLPAIGSSVALAVLIAQIGPLRRRLRPEAPAPPAHTGAAAWYALIVILVLGALLSAMMPFSYRPSLDRPRRDFAVIVPMVGEREPEHVVVLNTPGAFHTFYGPEIVSFLAGRQVDVRVLSSMNGVLSVERVDDRSLVVRADRSGWLTNIFAAMPRTADPPRLGQTFTTPLFTATVLAITRSGLDVLAVRFDFDRALDDPGLLFVAYDGERFVPMDVMQLPVGEAAILADTSDVWASMS